MARINVAGVSRCTAVAVAPEWAVTAAHCLYHRGLGRVVPAGAVHLLFGYVSEAFTLHVVADAVVLAPGWEPGAREVRGDDVALLHLPSPAPAVLRPVVGRLPAGTVVEAGGYGQDRGQRLMIDPACRVTGYAEAPGGTVLVHGCAGTRGTSGGPVVVRTAERWALAGVIVGAERDGVGGVAVPGETVGRLMNELRATR